MSPTHQKPQADLLAVSTLLATSAAIAWPVLTGGYLTYLDNPSHLAEVYALAFEARGGWSDVAFAGFPIATLHSPLWYGALGWLARVGFPAEPFYAFCVWLGFIAPPLALYGVARRRLGVLSAVFLAYLLLIQRPSIVGIGSPFGGMWTFYIASASLILFIDRIVRPVRSSQDLAWLAGLTGFTLLTHMFALIPLGILVLIQAWLRVERERTVSKTLLCQLGAVAIGVVAAAAYWLPLVEATGYTLIYPQNMSTVLVLARLLLPTDIIELLGGNIPPLNATVLLNATPMIAVVVLGVLGIFGLRRRRDDLPLLGILLAEIVLILVAIVAAEFDVKFLGPVSWRLLYFVRVGLCLAAVPLFSWAAERVRLAPSLSFAVALSIFAVAAGLWWGRPLAAVVPPPVGEEMSQVRELWRWVRENHDDSWGRLYLQDTFSRPFDPEKLSQSHILSLTSKETGVRQLGATYGVAPYRSAVWTPSEFGTLFRKIISNDEDVDYLRLLMYRTNATHVSVYDSYTRKRLADSPYFEWLHTSGRFHVFRSKEFESEWVCTPEGVAPDAKVQYETGRIILDIGDGFEGGNLLVKTSYHANWRLVGTTTATIDSDELGLMVLVGVEPGPRRLEIVYDPETAPLWISIAGWVSIIVMSLILPRKRFCAEGNI